MSSVDPCLCGTYRDGIIIPDHPLPWPDGTRVQLQIAKVASKEKPPTAAIQDPVAAAEIQRRLDEFLEMEPTADELAALEEAMREARDES